MRGNWGRNKMLCARTSEQNRNGNVEKNEWRKYGCEERCGQGRPSGCEL